MAHIHNILSFSLTDDSEQYAFLMPVMKALIDKCYDMLNMETYLPSLPMAAASPTFFDEFKSYIQESEWTSFMQKQVWILFTMSPSVVLKRI